MKKFLAILLVAVIAVSLLPACANTQQTETTQENPNSLEKSDPKEDGVMNVLMIGNSYCYYYVDELYGIAKAAGIDMKIYNVYYSGCTLEQHWTWLEQGEAKYEFFCTDENGRKKMENFDLNTCLAAENWDVISLQAGGRPYRTGGVEGALTAAQTYLPKLLSYIQERFPKAQYLWHSTWSHEVGYVQESADYAINTLEDQAKEHKDLMYVYQQVSQQFSLPQVPTGDAWKRARDYGVGDELCLRKQGGQIINDHSHDGDLGGGQYLNACVWFEVLTGQSILGNTWRPPYTLEEQKLLTLQKAAHEAVAALAQ